MKQKTLFKILASSIVLILVLMVINMNIYASITEDTDTGSITVAELEAGVEVAIYQLTNVNYDYIADQPQAVPYTWVSSVKTWVDANYAKYSDPEAFYNDVESNSSEARAFYSDLAAAIKGGEVTLATTQTKETAGTASYPVTEAVLKSSVTFENCEMGTYLILIENGYRVYTPSVINLTPEYDKNATEWTLESEVGVNVKSTTPQITKTVTNETLQKDNYSVLDEITYTIVTDVPNYEENSLATNYYISDIIKDGLVLNNNSIKVYGVNGTASEEVATTGYTLGTSRLGDLGEATFTLNFVYNEISEYEQLKVVYTATLDKSNATIEGSVGNNNIAYLDYSNNPYDITSVQAQESSAVVYTYGMEITTVDKTTKNVLPSAEYTLVDSSDTELYFIKGDTDGVYYLAESTDTDATTTIVSDANGKLYLYGLDEGTYELEQIKAPEGYNINTTKTEIIIVDENVDGALDDEEGTTGIYKVTIPNTQGFSLPVTGGIGTTIFTAAGVVLVGLGLVLMIVVLKKNRASK